MEFFRIIERHVNEMDIQDNVHPKNLEKFTETMFLLEGDFSRFQGATLWGEFSVSYDKINGGVRFALLDCPNAFAWTITTGYPPEREKILIHCTINRTQKHEKFVQEIYEFLDEWEKGLLAYF